MAEGRIGTVNQSNVPETLLNRIVQSGKIFYGYSHLSQGIVIQVLSKDVSEPCFLERLGNYFTGINAEIEMSHIAKGISSAILANIPAGLSEVGASHRIITTTTLNSEADIQINGRNRLIFSELTSINGLEKSMLCIGFFSRELASADGIIHLSESISSNKPSDIRTMLGISLINLADLYSKSDNQQAEARDEFVVE